MGNKLAWHNFRLQTLSVAGKWLEMASVYLLHGLLLAFDSTDGNNRWSKLSDL